MKFNLRTIAKKVNQHFPDNKWCLSIGYSLLPYQRQHFLLGLMPLYGIQ